MPETRSNLFLWLATKARQLAEVLSAKAVDFSYEDMVSTRVPDVLENDPAKALTEDDEEIGSPVEEVLRIEEERGRILRQWPESGEFYLKSGTKCEYIVVEGVLEWIVLTDRDGNLFEMPPDFFDLSLLPRPAR